MPTQTQDYKQLLTDVIKKQIVILGPDITLSKARNVKGLTIADDGTVTNVEGSPQEIIQALIDQFVQLSGLIVKKTMEPLLMATQQISDGTTPSPATSAMPTIPVAPVVAPVVSTPTAVNPTTAPVAVPPVSPSPAPAEAQTVAPVSPVPQAAQPETAAPIAPTQPTPVVAAPAQPTAPATAPVTPPVAPAAPVPTGPEQSVDQPTAAQPATNPLAA